MIEASAMEIVYWAGPLFTQAERDWNARIVNGLREAGFTVILPQERAEELIHPGAPLPVRRLYEYAIDGIRAADVIVAVLDGPDPDSGTSFECGYAHALGKPFIGLRTDLRLGGDDAAYNVNLMLSQGAAKCLRVGSEDLQDVVDSVVKAIAGVPSAV
jgi:nucleoside 2-deoxyribosyltransferase